MLQIVIEKEVAEYLDQYGDVTDNEGHRLAFRNRYLLEQKIITGVGFLSIR